MPLFGLKKNQEPSPEKLTPMGEQLVVKVLGSGCSKCNLLEKNVKEVLDELSCPYQLLHVRDYVEIAKYGVMQTPALVVDEKLMLSGRIATRPELKELLCNVK